MPHGETTWSHFFQWQTYQSVGGTRERKNDFILLNRHSCGSCLCSLLTVLLRFFGRDRDREPVKTTVERGICLSRQHSSTWSFLRLAGSSDVSRDSATTTISLCGSNHMQVNPSLLPGGHALARPEFSYVDPSRVPGASGHCKMESASGHHETMDSITGNQDPDSQQRQESLSTNSST